MCACVVQIESLRTQHAKCDTLACPDHGTILALFINALYVYQGEPIYSMDGNGFVEATKKQVTLGDKRTVEINIELNCHDAEYISAHIKMTAGQEHAYWRLLFTSHTGVAMPLRVATMSREIGKAFTETKWSNQEIFVDDGSDTSAPKIKRAGEKNLREVAPHSTESMQAFSTMLTHLAAMLHTGTKAKWFHPKQDGSRGPRAEVFVRLVKALASDSTRTTESNTCEDNEDCFNGQMCPITNEPLDKLTGVCVKSHCYDKNAIKNGAFHQDFTLLNGQGSRRNAHPLSRASFLNFRRG